MGRIDVESYRTWEALGTIAVKSLGHKRLNRVGSFRGGLKFKIFNTIFHPLLSIPFTFLFHAPLARGA